MEHPEWLGDFSYENLISLIENGSKIWIYYKDGEIVSSMMFIPSSKESAAKLGFTEYDYSKIVDYGPMMVNSKYIGNNLQFQMIKVLDDYSRKIGLEYAVSTVHPDNIFSIKNLLKADFVQVDQKLFSRGLRNIYFKKL